LRIETHHDDRVVMLGCETCDMTSTLRTADGDFAAAVQVFFEEHARCAARIDLTAVR
jgi:hypothetical protein